MAKYLIHAYIWRLSGIQMADHRKMEKKWQDAWAKAGLNKADSDKKKKFMLIFAYPGVTGYLHVGHMRGYTYVDAIGRFKRMTGHNVLFPVGTHATGNGPISLANRVRNKDPDTIDYLVRNGCPEDKLNDLTDPMNVVDFFNDIYVNDYWKRFGFLADWRRFTCTLYPDYGRFIEWQFRKLMDAGLLIQKPYYAPFCPSCGPVAIDASETDISKGGNAETQEYTLLKFKCGDVFLVAATLRPETVYGQVNFWVNPEVEYVKMKKGSETWIVSPQAAEKLSYQMDDISVIGKIHGKEMIGWMCQAPMIRRSVPVFPASFCDPAVGTGLVTSVPSDAPDDWISLRDVKNDNELINRYPGLTREMIDNAHPISIISMEGYGDFPAKDVIEQMGIERSGDPRLVEAKKQVYKDGYHMGRMKEICGPFAGMRVEEAKDKMKQAMIDSGEAELFHDLSEEVICRCGLPVMIRRVDDQWFINYADESLTKTTQDHCRTMNIVPSEYSSNVQGVLSWFRERACVRQGKWLGTKFPFDQRWTIEAISDSTLYPVYYVISHYANEGRIQPEQMNEAMFDLVMLGKGDPKEVSKSTGISEDILKQMRNDIEYWYPLDLNLGGKEHMTVHFPTFLFNHVAIMPREDWPKGIMVHWYITGKKGKISKSKGGAQPIPGAAEKFGVDALRLYYAHVASPFADVEWDEDIIVSYRQRIDRIYGFIEELKNAGSNKAEEGIDRWLVSRMNTHIRTMREAMDCYDLRQSASISYFEILNDMRWYVRRGGSNSAVIRDVLSIWIRSMCPMTPHTAEELWELCGFEGLASSADYPENDDSLISSGAEYGEELIRSVMSDIGQIIKVTGMDAKRVIVYTSPKWKSDVLRMAAELHNDGKLDIPSLTKAAMADESVRKNGKTASELAKKFATEIARNSYSLDVLGLNEYEHLKGAEKFIGSEIGVGVEVMSADGPAYDPQNKSKVAIPGRPAIYLE